MLLIRKINNAVYVLQFYLAYHLRFALTVSFFYTSYLATWFSNSKLLTFYVFFIVI